MPTDNSIFRLLPTQIVPFWDAIKFTCVKADEVKKEEMPNYFNELLQALLSDKAQVFVVLDNNRILHSIAVTRISFNKVLQQKELHIQCLYSMTTMDDVSVVRYFAFIADFAKREGCACVLYNSRNPRIWEIAQVLGCPEVSRTFAFNLGGK